MAMFSLKMKYIARAAARTLERLSKSFPIVTITGPRQSGKTTLSKIAFPDKTYVSLENPATRDFALEDPKGFLDRLKKGAVIDEIQRVPELFSYLQEIADEPFTGCRFILTGSQQFDLVSSISQSLAGRTGFLTLLPFSIEEIRPAISKRGLDQVLLEGFYPPLHARSIIPADFYPAYIHSYLERDVRRLLNIRDLADFQKFLRLCAGRTANLLNLQELGRDCGISHTTARHWLSVLEASYVVFRLQPYHGNFGKRAVKTPKLYFYDSGIAAFLLGIRTREQMETHPLRGQLFENMIIADILKERYNSGLPPDIYFWRDSNGHEVDLILQEGASLIPVEIKSGTTLKQAWFDNLTGWKAVSKQKTVQPLLVYGGIEEMNRSGIRVKSWKSPSFSKPAARFAGNALSLPVKSSPEPSWG